MIGSDDGGVISVWWMMNRDMAATEIVMYEGYSVTQLLVSLEVEGQVIRSGKCPLNLAVPNLY